MIELNKILKIIPKDEKKNTIVFLFLTVLTTLLESFSIGLIFPLIVFGLSDDIKNEKFYLLIENYVKNYSYEQILFILIVILATVYIFKNIYLLYLHWWKQGFNNRVRFKIDQRLLKIYLHQPLLKILEKNSAFKVRNIVAETSNFSKFFSSSMQLFIEIMVFLGITLLIFLLQPLAAIYVLSIIFLITLIFYILAKIKTVKWSKKRIFYNGLSIKTLMEGLSAIKEIKVFKKESFFIDNFSFNNKKGLHFSRLFSTFNESPKLIIEAASILAISVAMFAMFYNGEDKNQIIAMVGIFAAAGIRLLPSASRIIFCINDIKNNLPSIDLIIEEFKLENNLKNFKIAKKINNFKNQIELKNIKFSYPGKKKPIFDDLSIKIKKGTINAIIGQSGTGKSTILNILLGFVKAEEGKYFIDGEEITENTTFAENLFGYVSQEILLLDETIKFNISFGEKNFDKDKLSKSIKISQLEDFISKLDQGDNTNIGEKGLSISGGQRQRLSIARAIYQNPNILILDEATNELDEINENKIIKNLKSHFKEKTIILTTHNQNILKFCDQIIDINNGVIEITKNEKVL